MNAMMPQDERVYFPVMAVNQEFVPGSTARN